MEEQTRDWEEYQILLLPALGAQIGNDKDSKSDISYEASKMRLNKTLPLISGVQWFIR